MKSLFCLSVLAFLFTACDDDDDVREDATPAVIPDAAIQREDAAIQREDAAIQREDAAIQEEDAAIQEEDAAIQREDASIVIGPDQTCADLGATECMFHDDCPDDQVCKNLAAPGEIEHPCCVTGRRGTDPVGAPCDPAQEDGYSLTCASGLCITPNFDDENSICSATCVGQPDCPDDMACYYVPLMGSFCLPCTSSDCSSAN